MKVLMLFFTLLVGVIMAIPVEGKGLSPPQGVEITVFDQVAPEMVAMMPETLPVGLSHTIDTSTTETTNAMAIMPSHVNKERVAIGLLFNNGFIQEEEAAIRVITKLQDREAIGLCCSHYLFILSC